jgi:aerobic carbon-monoxide dehydrogenase large subunit
MSPGRTLPARYKAAKTAALQTSLELLAAVCEPLDMPSVGQPLRRVEDPRLLVGAGQFLDDLPRDGVLHVAFLRSPHAHARIVKVDADAAKTLSGVALVVTGVDIAGSVNPMRVEIAAPWHRATTRPHLAIDRVRFAGEAVVMVVAESRYLAEDALELIEVEYEPLQTVTTVDEALRPDAPSLHDDVPGNLLIDRTYEFGEPRRAFAKADVVVEVELDHGRQLPSPIEARAIQASWDESRGELTVWCSTQVPYGVRRVLAESLHLDSQKVRVIVPDVGGGFGLKLHAFTEDVLVALAALRVNRPVRWVEDRIENMRAGSQSRNGRITARAAARQDGTLAALESDVTFDQGAYGNFPFGSILEPMGAASMIPGPYRLAHYSYRARAVATNKCPEGAYRGVGMVLATLVHERLMDELARALSLDPAEVRHRNLLVPTEFPYASAGGHVYDSGSFQKALDRALKAANYDELRAKQRAARAQGRLQGIGISCYTEYTGVGSSTFAGRGMNTVSGLESAKLSLQPNGRLSAAVSLPAIGQGVATTYRQLLADELGVDLSGVDITIGDTAGTVDGSGAMASRRGALKAAAQLLIEQLRPTAAERLEVAADDLLWRDGAFHVIGVLERSVTLADLTEDLSVRRDGAPHSFPEMQAGDAVRSEGGAPSRRTPRRAPDASLGSSDPFTASAVYDPAGPAFASATHVAAIEIDRETGRVSIQDYVIVEDCGPLINPMIVEGQVHGAAAQGISGTLLEEVVYDRAGQLVTGSLLDYLLPAATDVPFIEVLHEETPSPHSPGGHKGAGEGGTVGAPAAIWNAVADALLPLGVSPGTLPLTPARILEAISAARG